MKRIYFLLLFLQLIFKHTDAQHVNAAQQWTDSIYNSLSSDERIGQLMIARLSSIDPKTKLITFLDSSVTALVKKYNIGGVCVFQGSPVKQAIMINALQAIAKTPLLMSIDAEWGVGMRITDSVLPLPRQMMLGAVTDTNIVYQYGKIVAEQCKRIGLQVNYAPVVDVNNNPNNPVINERSFGEDKYKVAQFGIQYMKGMQGAGVMACAKHFPGHGDVAVDSHFDLPIINKTMPQLDSLELYPFREIFKAGISSVMLGHLYIPSIDTTANRATSLSKNNVTGLLLHKIGFNGLLFTDGLEMKGVTKFFPGGEVSVQALIAGNDMLCLPEDIPLAIDKIKAAIANNKLSWADIERHCKKVLLAKYKYGLVNLQPINTENLTNDLNSKIKDMRKLVAVNALTILNNTNKEFFPLQLQDTASANNIAYIGVGNITENAFAARMRKDYNAAVFNFNYKQDTTGTAFIINAIKARYKKVIIGIHNYSRVPANNFGISNAAVDFVTKLQQQTNALTFVFGNPYAIKNFCVAKNLIACYEDDDIIQNTAIDLLQGKITAKGKLPVTVCEAYKFGSGITTTGFFLPPINQTNVAPGKYCFDEIDSIANTAIEKGATPGCVVMVVKDGKIAYHKSFGYYNYDKLEKVTVAAVYDMASVTKVCATTLAIMKLYEQGKMDLTKKLGDYLTTVKGTNKEQLGIENILLHQAGLLPYIPFYKETIDTIGVPYTKIYAIAQSDSFNIPVADNLFLRKDWMDTMFKRILQSPLTATGKYVYSDNDFIFLGKIVEAISGMPLDKYVQKEFYKPMVLSTAGFKPREYMPLNKIVPTEQEPVFRKQLIRGVVHDPGAAMFGGVAGHAGLFSNAYDMAVIMQMLLNGGTFNGRRYLQKETIDLFTAYHSNESRRGLGFDKPEKDNYKRQEPYPCKSISRTGFGHTGFTGTCVWADPKYNLVYVFLSNRVTPNGENTKLLKMNVRTAIQEAVYKTIKTMSTE